MFGLSKPAPNKYKDGTEFKTFDWRQVVDEIVAEEEKLKRQQELNLLPNCNKYRKKTGTNVFNKLTGIKTITTENCNPTNLPDCDIWARTIKNANANTNVNGWAVRKKNVLDGKNTYVQCNEAKLPLDNGIRIKLMNNYLRTLSDEDANTDANNNREKYPLVKTLPDYYITDTETQIGGKRKTRKSRR